MADTPMMLKLGLVLTIIIDLVYGVMFILTPTFYFELAGGDPFDAGVLRWSGGVLIALGIGALRVLKAPARQGIFVETLLLSYLLAALAHTYGVFMQQYTGQIWVLGMPMVGVWFTTIVLFVGRNQARELLQ